MRLFDNSVKHGNSNHYCCIHCFPSLYFLLRTALQVVVILQLQWPTTATQSHSNCCVTASYKIDCNIIVMRLHQSCNELLFTLLIQKFHIVTTTMQTMISAILSNCNNYNRAHLRPWLQIKTLLPILASSSAMPTRLTLLVGTLRWCMVEPLGRDRLSPGCAIFCGALIVHSS